MDFIKIIRKGLYSKYKSDEENFYIAQINLILFKPKRLSSKYFLGNYLKEMSIYNDGIEYFDKYYYKYDSYNKLKILGYIYFNNFNPPPNYLSFENSVNSIMFKLLREKQNLINRNIVTNFLIYEKSRNKKTKKKLKKINDDNNFFKTANSYRTNISSFSNYNNQSIEKNNNLYEKENSKNIINIFQTFRKSKEIKYKEKEINNNSNHSITKLVKKLKSIKINNIINKNKIKLKISTNSKNQINKIIANNHPLDKNKHIMFSSQNLFHNKNNIMQLIKNRDMKNKKITKYKLSVEDFKENLKKNRKYKMKKYFDNFWKLNKNFVTNLIENKNIIKFSPIFSNKKFFSTNYSEIINNFLSFKSQNTTKVNNPKKLKGNIFYKNKLSSKNKREINPLINKIQNNSDFIKNKKYSCVFSKENKNNTNNRNVFSSRVKNLTTEKKSLSYRILKKEKIVPLK